MSLIDFMSMEQSRAYKHTLIHFQVLNVFYHVVMKVLRFATFVFHQFYLTIIAITGQKF